MYRKKAEGDRGHPICVKEALSKLLAHKCQAASYVMPGTLSCFAILVQSIESAGIRWQAPLHAETSQGLTTEM